MLAAAGAGNLVIRSSEHGVILAGVNSQRPFLPAPERQRIEQEPLRFPGFDILLGEAVFVGGGEVSLLTQNSRRLMLPVTVARSTGEAQNDNVGTVMANGPDHVRQDALASPFLDGLLGCLAKTEVDRAREE